METYIIKFYLYCCWKDFPPVYRIYVDGELVTERNYIWDNDKNVLQECIPIITDYKEANVIIEQAGQQTGTFKVENIFSEPSGLDINVNIT